MFNNPRLTFAFLNTNRLRWNPYELQAGIGGGDILEPSTIYQSI